MIEDVSGNSYEADLALHHAPRWADSLTGIDVVVYS